MYLGALTIEWPQKPIFCLWAFSLHTYDCQYQDDTLLQVFPLLLPVEKVLFFLSWFNYGNKIIRLCVVKNKPPNVSLKKWRFIFLTPSLMWSGLSSHIFKVYFVEHSTTEEPHLQVEYRILLYMMHTFLPKFGGKLLRCVLYMGSTDSIAV